MSNKIINLFDLEKLFEENMPTTIAGYYKSGARDEITLKKNREILNYYIKKNCIWAIASASIREIEKHNILNASLLAMKRAIIKLKKKPQLVLVDGNKLPKINNYNLKNIIKGDQKIPEISAASIIAKVSRDKLISKMGKNFKKYLWNKNSGYGTKGHIQAIKKFGITKYHRKTFRPVHNILSLR